MVLGAQGLCKKHRLFLCYACTLRPSYLRACRVPLRQGLNWFRSLARETPHSSKNRSNLNPIVRMPIFSIGSRDSGAAVLHKYRTVHFQKNFYPIGAGSYMALIKLFSVKMVLGAQVPCKKHPLFLCCACTLQPSYLLSESSFFN